MDIMNKEDFMSDLERFLETSLNDEVLYIEMHRKKLEYQDYRNRLNTIAKKYGFEHGFQIIQNRMKCQREIELQDMREQIMEEYTRINDKTLDEMIKNVKMTHDPNDTKRDKLRLLNEKIVIEMSTLSVLRIRKVDEELIKKFKEQEVKNRIQSWRDWHNAREVYQSDNDDDRSLFNDDESDNDYDQCSIKYRWIDNEKLKCANDDEHTMCARPVLGRKCKRVRLNV